MHIFRIISVHLPHWRGGSFRSSANCRRVCNGFHGPWLADEFKCAHCFVLSDRDSLDRFGLGTRDRQDWFHPWSDSWRNVVSGHTGHPPRFLGGVHTPPDCDDSGIYCGIYYKEDFSPEQNVTFPRSKTMSNDGTCSEARAEVLSGQEYVFAIIHVVESHSSKVIPLFTST